MSGRGGDVIAAATGMMDDLLEEEDRAFARLDEAVQRTADATRERVVAATQLSRVNLARAALLPDDEWLGDLLLPPVSDLIALSREQAVRVVDKQMRLCAQRVGPHAAPVGRQAASTARAAAPEWERRVFATAADSMVHAAGKTRDAVTVQRRTWQARHEDTGKLIARLCSPDRVALPGAGKGAVWQLAWRMHAVARSACVETSNGLLLAGMRGWNIAADTVEQEAG